MFKLFKSTPPTVDRSTARRRETDSGARLRPPADWAAVREPLPAAQLQLSAVSKAWLETLPPEVVPKALADRFARIVNRFALIWPDAVLTERYFDSLMIDRRGGRQGFPPDVMSELIRLRAFHTQSRPARQPVDASGALAMKPIEFT